MLDIRLSADEFDIGLGGGRRGKELFVKIVSSAGLANQPWASFNVFGQVGIHSTKLIGVIKNKVRKEVEDDKEKDSAVLRSD